MEYLITFLEGIVTFLSPCMLPLLPIYLSFFAGGADAAPAGADAATPAPAPSSVDPAPGAATNAADLTPATRPRIGHTLLCASCFVLGFGIVFVAMGAFAGTLGSLLVRYRRVLDLVCGACVIVLGLGYLDLLPLPAFGRITHGVRNPARTPLGCLLFGLVFSVSWTPCVGTFLGSALSLAAASASATKGIALLVCYSLGLGLPFVLAALVVDQLAGAFAWVREHYAVINKVCGVFLVLVGILMASGLLGTWLGMVSA